MTLTFTVSDEVRAIAPGFTHLAVEAHGLVNGPSDTRSAALLDDAARRLAERLEGRAPHEDPRIAAWREVYTAFGAKPSRTRNSAEALARRALADGGLPRINLLVDAYNAISVAHLVPVGGEDTDHIKGGMRLIRATGDEPFPTVMRRRGGGGAPRARRSRLVRRRGRHLPPLELAPGCAHPAHGGVGQRRLPAGGPRTHDER